MSTHSDKLIRFSSLSVDVKEPVRAEIQQQIDDWLAAGNKIQVVPPFVYVPKPVVERTVSTKRVKKVRTRSPHVSWLDPEEILALRFMKAQGMISKAIAAALNEHWHSDRNERSVMNFCSRNGIYSGAGVDQRAGTKLGSHVRRVAV